MFTVNIIPVVLAMCTCVTIQYNYSLGCDSLGTLANGACCLCSISQSVYCVEWGYLNKYLLLGL